MILVVYFIINVALLGMADAVIRKIENKYSYQLFFEYFKGGVNNPYAFYRTSIIYREQEKFSKEKIELLYARNILNVEMGNELINTVNLRIAELEKMGY